MVVCLKTWSEDNTIFNFPSHILTNPSVISSNHQQVCRIQNICNEKRLTYTIKTLINIKKILFL
jgi:6-phosphogluconolactonase/glucosamine-6-phosphate isomerase/deaminase